MARKNRDGFADVLTTRAAFERDEARCPRCHRPIGPSGNPSFVHQLGGGPPRLATMRCGRCNVMLTLRFEEEPAQAS